MIEAKADAADLVNQMAEAEELIYSCTRELLWWNALVFVVALLAMSATLVAVGVAVLTGVWVIRKQKVVWLSAVLSAALIGLTLYGGWRTVQHPTTKAAMDLAILALISWQVVVAALATARYRKLATAFSLRVGAKVGPRSQ